MKRYLDLILKLLEFTEEQANGDVHPPEVPGYSLRQVHYHVGLCKEAGYMKVRELSGGKKFPRYRIISLTWQGHEAMEELRKQFDEN